MQPTHSPETTSEQKGLVISYFGNSVAVKALDGQVFQCHLRRNQALPVVGDEVMWQREAQGQTGVILSTLPRRSMLAKGDNRGQLKPIAANIDVVVIVMVPPPIFSEYLLDRYLVAAACLDLQAMIVLNKIDLLTAASRESAFKRLKPYEALHYPVIATSVFNQEGIPRLAESLAGKGAVLVGPSGVGKSSIISTLVGEDIRTGEVSDKGTGKHTTTATKLYHLPKGGYLIDSPGVREFSLWPISKEALLKGFKEFAAFMQDCRFRDCQHLQEPGCGVHRAVENGSISPERYANFQLLLKETNVRTR